MDVFVRVYRGTPVRSCLTMALLYRLEDFPNIRVTILSPSSQIPIDSETYWYQNEVGPFKIGEISEANFHIFAKCNAEHLAKSDIYCVMDDDQLPLPNDFFEQGRIALENHPEYGMLAGFPLEYGLSGQPYAERTEDVIEAHSIGCPYFVRKGTLSFPDGPLRQYDGILSKVVTDQGLKTGFARKCLYNHLGYGFSQVEHVD